MSKRTMGDARLCEMCYSAARVEDEDHVFCDAACQREFYEGNHKRYGSSDAIFVGAAQTRTIGFTIGEIEAIQIGLPHYLIDLRNEIEGVKNAGVHPNLRFRIIGLQSFLKNEVPSLIRKLKNSNSKVSPGDIALRVTLTGTERTAALISTREFERNHMDAHVFFIPFNLPEFGPRNNALTNSFVGLQVAARSAINKLIKG